MQEGHPSHPAKGSGGGGGGGGGRRAVSFPSGVWGGAPAANAFLLYHAQNTT